MPTLDFKGKPFVYSHHLSVPFRELKIDADKSLAGEGGPSLDDNLIIHGDNLHALKALLPKYAGKVDVIFIDPPYNTGGEGWAYNDNVNSPLMKEWLGDVVDGDDLERHDKWLCMMWPRLVLLRELLSDSGSIWITLDDNESHRAKLMLDEVFGKESFLANIVWQHSIQGKGYNSKFSVHHNHLFAYGKSKFEFDGLERTEEDNINYSNPDNDPNGRWRSGDTRNSLYRPNLIYDLPTPSGKIISPPEKGWRWKLETFQKKIESGEAIFTDDETRVVRKIYLKNQEKRAPETIWFAKDVGSTRDATKMLKTIFEGESPFATPKPIDLIKRVASLHVNKQAIYLDSFAGSGTTAHAIQALNAEDGGNRKFILVETEDYADTITAERVRRVMKGVPSAKDEALQNGLGGSFTYCDLGEPIDMESFFGESDSMPAYDQLASYIAYTATGEALDNAPKKPAKDWFIGEVGGVRLHLIYKPDSAFMKSHEAALDMDTVQTIAAGNKTGKPSYVFAAAKYMGQTELTRDYDMTFCQLPYAIHRIMGDGVDG